MSARVGSGHVAVFPVMTGFKRAVSNEMKSAGTAGSRDFETSLKGAGKSAGTRLGRDLKGSFDSASKGLGDGGLKTLQRDVATASAALSKARLKQQDEAGKVRVAEARLAEQVSKYGASSSQAVAAEERLESARRRQVTVNEAVADATVRLKDAQKAVADVTKDAGDAATGAQWKFSSFLDSVKGKAADAGRSLKQHLGDGLTKAADVLRGPATAAVGAAATGLTIALTKGFGRLNAIDGARAKLTGLGHDGQTVAAIMDNAGAAVKGTAFGLGEAATVAAGAVASGIKPGKELEANLKGVANVAAATNRTMEDTGAIFNNVRANQTAYTDDIKQLANSGLPIWDSLQKTLGKTQDEVREMATKGEIDFDTFSRAAADAAGTVAQEMGSTVPTSLSNLWASVGRIGANILGGINTETGEMYGLYAKFAPLIQAVTSALGPIEDKAKEWGAILNDRVGPILDKITGLISSLGEGTSGLTDRFKDFSGLLGPLGGMLLALGSGGLGGLIGKIPVLGSMLGGLGGVFKLLGGPIGLVAGLVAGFFATGGDASGLVDSVTAVVNGIVGYLPQFVSMGVDLLGSLIQGVLSALPGLIGAASQILTTLIGGIVAALPTIVEGAIGIVEALITGIVENLPMIIEAALTLVTSLLTGIVEALPMIIEAGITLLVSLIQGIIEALPMLLEAALTLVTGLLTAIVENLPLVIQAGITLLMSLIQGLIQVLPELITTAITLVLQLVDGLLTMFPELIQAGITLILALVTGLLEALPEIMAAIPELVAAIVDGFMGVDWLSLGVNIIQGIIAGIVSMGGALWDAVTGIASQAFDGVKSFFGIASPSKLMRDKIGRMLPAGLALGMQDETASAVRAAEDMARQVSDRTVVTIDAVSNASATGRPGDQPPHAAGGGSQVTFNVEQNYAHEDPEVARERNDRELARLFEGV